MATHIAHCVQRADQSMREDLVPGIPRVWERGQSEWTIVPWYGDVGDRRDCVGLVLLAREGSLDGLTTGVLRGMPFSDVVRGGVTEEEREVREARRPPRWVSEQEDGRGRPREHDYEEVEDVYRRAFKAGLPPTKAVAQAYGLTAGAAAALVRRMREKEFLHDIDPQEAQRVGKKPTRPTDE